jgi:GNAT superfamily N-acetyltransferase
MNGTLRLARMEDVPQLEQLIPLSVRTLQAAHYSPAQMEAALGPVFGVDTQLIRDGTYFVVTEGDKITGCGGWSKRKTLFGGSAGRQDDDSDQLDPAKDAARIRAFFVHPEHARQGIGRMLLTACEEAIARAGFSKIDLVATLAGEPLYARFGYQAVQRYEIDLPGGLKLPGVKMTKTIS